MTTWTLGRRRPDASRRDDGIWHVLKKGWAFLAAAVACLAPMTMRALDPQDSVRDYVVRHWDVEDGLPSHLIRHIVQTSDGYLWLGTAEGLARFDGLTFTAFRAPYVAGIAGNFITSLAETADGSLWIGTSTGLSRYQHGRFVAYTRQDGLKTDTVNSLCVAPDGSLWIGGSMGITRWVNGRFLQDIDTSAYNMLSLQSVRLDRTGAIWIALATEVLRYSAGTFTRFGSESGLPSSTIRSIREDAEGRIIALTQRGLFRLEAGAFLPYTPVPAGRRLNASMVDRDANLWVGSAEGLERISGGATSAFIDASGAAPTGVDAIFEDREGCVWFGNSTGLYRLTNRRGRTFSVDEGVLGTFGMAVKTTRDGSVWASSWGGGAARFWNGTVRQYRAGAPLSHETATLFYEAPDGTLWIGNRGSAVDHLEGEKVTTYVYPPGVPTSRFVSAMHIDARGEILIAIAGRGLFHLRNGEYVPVPEAAALTAAVIWQLHPLRDGRLLLVTSVGLYERSAGGAIERRTLPGLPETLYCRQLMEDEDGTIWLATEGFGLVRWQGAQARSYGLEQGMVSDNVSGVLDDGAASIWVTSPRGLARILRQEFAAFEARQISRINVTVFGRADGLVSSPTTSRGGATTAARMPDGRLMFAAAKGLSVMDPRRIRVNTQPPNVIVEAVEADDRLLPAASGEGVVIPAGTNRVEIRYTALSLVAPQRLRFRYQLEGSDPGWIEAEANRSASYTHLAPGDYTFRVLACNNDGIWNSTGATLSLHIEPRYYQTLWFQGAGVVLACGVIAGGVRLRVRRYKLRQDELARTNAELDRRVQERTIELANIHKRLLETSRHAGMAEVATGVLHNVGNVLNSVNVSAAMVTDRIRQSKSQGIAKLAGLLEEQGPGLGEFLANDPRGRKVPQYLRTLAESLEVEKNGVLAELENLRTNIDHIKEIVAMQQSYASNAGFIETVSVPDVVEDAIRMNAGSLARHDIDIVRDYAARPVVTTDKHKVMQILINLIRNAKYACDESGRTDKRMIIRTTTDDQAVHIAVIDNGVGVPAENLTRIFNHGFTTRKNGHGFGLHSGALAAKELGGAITVKSDGPGQGATFTLTIPFRKPGAPHPGSAGPVATESEGSTVEAR